MYLIFIFWTISVVSRKAEDIFEIPIPVLKKTINTKDSHGDALVDLESLLPKKYIYYSKTFGVSSFRYCP